MKDFIGILLFILCLPLLIIEAFRALFNEDAAK